MKVCAVYARFSSEVQRATSLEDQIRNCRRWAAQLGWRVADDHVYQDAARSGVGIDHRPAYQRLVTAALTVPPPFAVVLVDDLSRVSRDLVETLRLYRRLQRNGVELISISDGIQTSTQMAKLQITIKGLVNELFLDDLRDKTHRGLTGQALRGLSAGGRCFGYRTIPKGPGEAAGAAWTVFDPEAAVVCRIFQWYLDGLSMKAIALRLNQEGIPFPAQATRRGPGRRGWAVSTIHTILTNEKYIGRWVWNKTAFVKDPETGKRTAIPRPPTDWVEVDRPDLRVVDHAVWQKVQARIATVRAAYGGTTAHKRPRGQAPQVYSPYLLSGFTRCGICGGPVTVQTSCRRKKSGLVYRYARYRCSFHVTKGPTVCPNPMSIRHDALETALVSKLSDAMTPEMVDYLVGVVNEMLQAPTTAGGRDLEAVAEDRHRVDLELSNLIAFVAKGDDTSPRLRDEIRTRERRLEELDAEAERLRQAVAPSPLRIHRSWVEEQLEGLTDLLATDPAGARRELRKHLDDLCLTPAPEIGERVIRVTGRGKIDGLLGDQEAVRLQLVAGAGFEPATFGL
jgi:site-specific DNA recombinase